MKITRLISCALALFLLISGIVGLFGCQEPNDDEGTETQSQSQSQSESTEAEANADKLKLIDSGESEYVVVYPNDASAIILGAVDLFISKVEEKTGVRLKSKSDNLRGQASHDPNEKVILIGRTNYEESQDTLASLGRFEYKIAKVKNKMVIVALSEDDLKTAVNYYLNNLLTPNITGNEGARSLFLEEYHYIPKDSISDIITVNGTDISEFSIVFPSDDAEYAAVANDLKSAVLAKLGVELPVYSDSKSERENEILFGKTNRALSQQLYNNEQNYVMAYSVEVSGSKLQIFSGGYYSALECVTNMSYSELPGGAVDITDGSYIKTDIMENYTELAEGADIRIINSNVLHSEWAEGMLDVKYRAEIFAGILKYYQPDAVGIQELNDRWITELTKWLDILRENYSLDYELKHSGANCAKPILYRADMYDCVEAETHTFSHISASDISITMCQLSSKTDSSKEFIIMNTHWDVDSWAGARKDICSEESAAFLNKWKSAECPIIMTGDWNALRSQACIEDFMEATGVQTADDDTYCIEFTFFHGDNVTVKDKALLTQFKPLSDHYARYTDFDLW